MRIRLSPALLPLVIPTALILIFIALANRGFDVTDEAFYLLNAWHPDRNEGALSEFGRYLNLFVKVFGTDVAELRIAGLLALFLPASFLIYQAIRLIDESLPYTLPAIERSLIISCSGIAVFGFYNWWLPTPSYNTFSAAGAMIVAATLLWVYRLATGPSIQFLTLFQVGIALGAGGFIAAIGRPTSAAALGFCAAFWMFVVLRPRYCLTIGTVAVGTMLILTAVHVWCVYGFGPEFPDQIAFGRQLHEVIGTGHTLTTTLSRIVESIKSAISATVSLPVILSLGIALLTIGVTHFLNQKASHTPTWLTTSWALPAALGLLALSLKSMGSIGLSGLLGFFGVNCVAYMGVINLCAAINLQILYDVKYRRLYAGVAILVMASLAHPAGSTMPLIPGSSTTFLHWYLAGVMLIYPIAVERDVLARISLLTTPALFCIFILAAALVSPYRLSTHILRQTEAITFGSHENAIRVDPKTAEWVRTLQIKAKAEGWTPGTRLIDLTGKTPGAAVVLEGWAPVTPWIAGGYPGSREFAVEALRRDSPDALATAWVLTSPSSERRIPESVLNEVGLDFPAGYKLVATVTKDEPQFLWKPVR